MFNLTMLIGVYRTFGRETARRMLTIPERDIRRAAKILNLTETQIKERLEQRNEATNEVLNLIESLIDKDWTDPDDE